MTGAARMAGRAAARAGAGLTTIAVSEIALPIYATALTSIMVRPLAAPEDFNHLLGDQSYLGFFDRAGCRRRRGDSSAGACHVGERSAHAARRGCAHFLSGRSCCARSGNCRPLCHDAP